MFGDFINGSKIFSNGVEVTNFSPYTEKTKAQIDDPVKYDGLVPSVFIEKLYKEIDYPQSINDIIKYNSDDAKNKIVISENLNKIIIKGTCLNQNYSLMCFSDVTAKTYIKNLKFVNTLRADDDGLIDILGQLNSGLPSKEQILLQYPFNEDFKPIIHEPLYDYLRTVSNEPYFNLVSGYIKTINTAIKNLSGLMLNDNVTVNGDDYISYRVNDSVIEVLAAQAEELSLLPGVEGNWVQIDLDEEQSTSSLSTSILGAMKTINLAEEGIDEDVLTADNLSACITRFERAYESINDINNAKPLDAYDLYKDAAGTFEDETFIYDVKKYMSAVEYFKNELSASFQASAFSIFLSLRPDIVSSDNYSVYTNQEAFEEFLNNYKVEASFNSIVYALSGLSENVVKKIVTSNFDTLEDDLSFTINEGISTFKNVIPIKNTSDDFIKSNHSDGSVDAVQFSYNLNSGKSSYLSLSSKYGKQLGKLLFESNYWGNLKQKFLGDLPNHLRMFNSKWDSTIVFWTKFNYSTDTDRVVILSFSSGTNQKFRFSIKPHSYASISMNNSDDGDSIGNLSSAELKNPIFGTDTTKIDDRYSWVMWSIKFDNSTKYFEKGLDDGPDFRHYNGLNVTTYTFEPSNNVIGYNIVKHDLNVKPMNDDDASSLGEIINFKEPNYVWEPFESNPLSGFPTISNEYYEDQFDDFTINIGYSKEPSINGNNSYYYDGYFRNLTFFKGHLTSYEETALFRLGILNNYEWSSDYENEQLTELINNGTFFLGLVSIYDSNNINIINCESKYDGITYKIEKNE